MSDPRDYKLDIAGLGNGGDESNAGKARPYLSVMFACCSVYQRIYRKPSATEYVAQCPKCLRSVKFKVAAGGTTDRTFVVE